MVRLQILSKKNKRIKYQCQKIGAMTEGLNTFIFLRDYDNAQ